MHLADSLTRRRRYAARLIAGNHKQTRFFCFARGSVAAKPIFGGASDRFAANLLACGFQSTFILGGASGSFLAGFLARYFTCFFTCDFEAAFVFGLAGRSFTARLFACSLPRGFETALLFGGASGSFTTGLFTHGLAHSFKAPVFFGGAGGSFTTRFLARGLARSLANGVKAACLFGLADRGITRGGIARWSVAARLATAALPRRRSLAAGIVASRLIAATLAPGRFVAIPFAVRAIVIPLVAGPAVVVAAMGLTLPARLALPMRLALARTLVALVAAILAVWAAFVSHVVSGLVALAACRRRRFRHGRAERAPVGGVVAAVLSDHPVEPLIDRHVDALRCVALSLARLRTEASQIPRTARLHPRAQTTSGGAICAPLSGRR
ncbi:MAG TPA: hypothetical protein VIJ04_02945 [Xanthobacteraceae bacterium]